jgi:transcriptional regulator with PAS, ATPase and Fis domain
MAGLATGTFEAQLFGYVAGAYSGSGKGSPGLFRAHEGGAVFLDEIGELSLELQAKLLRVLENREILPVGAVRSVPVDVFIVAATNRSLEEAVAQGSFRRDLLARLASARIELPPLRERAEDIFAISEALARTQGDSLESANVEVEAIERIMLHELRSNVRELAAVLQRAFAADRKPTLRLETVERILGPLETAPTSALTVALVQEAIRAAGSESAAARRLGITRGKLRRFLQSEQ